MSVDMTTQSIAVADNWEKVGNDYIGSSPSGAVSGTPVISGFSGSFGQGNTITLNVSNVTTKNSTQVMFAVGDSGQNGVDATTILPNQPALDASNYKHSTAKSFMGSGASLLAEMQTGATGSEDTYVDLGSPQDAIYFSSLSWVDVNTVGANTDGQQLKLQRFNAEGGHSGEPMLAQTLFWNTDDVVMTNDYVYLFTTGRNTSSPKNNKYSVSGFGNWKRTQMYWQASDVDQDNGSVWLLEHDERDGTTYHGGAEWTTGNAFNDPSVLQSTNPEIWIPKQNWCTRRSSDSASQNMTKVWLPFYKRGSSQVDVYVDGIYINNSLERVELGNASTYETCTKRVVQEQTNRQSSSIAFECYEANFTASDDIYAFAFNEFGEYSVGHLIRSGA